MPPSKPAPRSRRAAVVVRAEEGAPAPKKEVGPKRGSQVRTKEVVA